MKNAAYLIDATGTINSRGQVAGLAIQINSGEIHAFLATPCDSDNHSEEGCADNVAGLFTFPTKVGPDTRLTDNARVLLRQGATHRGALKP